MHLAEELILKKRNGLELSKEEIFAFVEGISNHLVSDAQIAAFTMATWFRGMSLEEKTTLTLAMRDSGEVLAWEGLDGPILDKHSTGGVGDLVSLLLGPIVASCGAYIPMISGRGLGHTGGTLDKLESIPGFETHLGIERFQQLVRDHRIAIIGQTDELAPADRRIYAIRDVTASVDSIPLIISSILSKKLAEGLDALVMDIKFGSGAWTPEPEEALKLAQRISRVACTAGLPCNALVTAMDQPLAWTAGNALEIGEVVRFLRGDARNQRLQSVVLSLSSELLQLSGMATDPGKADEMALDSLESGRAAEQFAVMVAAQGGPSGLLQNADSFLPSAPLIRPVFADGSGFISSIDTKAVGSTVVYLGGGRRGAEDAIDPSVGIADIAEIGQQVDSDIPLAVIHAASESSWEHAATRLKSSFQIGPGQVGSLPVIYARVEGEQTYESS
jgi:thymidine phosphorylase